MIVRLYYRPPFNAVACPTGISSRTPGEVLALVSDILDVAEQQGKLLIDVPEGWVPEKWVTAVRADTQRGIDYTNAMELSDSDVLSPEKRREIALLRLLVRELQRLWTIGAYGPVQRIGHALHNVHQWLRMPDEPGSDAWSTMYYFRAIGADWNELSLEMREGCCRVAGLDLQTVEGLIKTPEFFINPADSK